MVQSQEGGGQREVERGREREREREVWKCTVCVAAQMNEVFFEKREISKCREQTQCWSSPLADQGGGDAIDCWYLLLLLFFNIPALPPVGPMLVLELGKAGGKATVSLILYWHSAGHFGV